MVYVKEEKLLQDCYNYDDLLLKPFAFGWTREVVNRAIIKNKNPSCDIYYFSPSGKKIRSSIEVKSHLTDGLTCDCFSFKRQPLGFNKDFETIRNARQKKKEANFSIQDKTRSLRVQKRSEEKETLEKEKNNIFKKCNKIKLITNTKSFKNNDENSNYKKKGKEIEKRDLSMGLAIATSFTIKNEIGEVEENKESHKKRKKNDKWKKMKNIKKEMRQNSEKKGKVVKKRINQKVTENEKMFKNIITKKTGSSGKLLKKKVEKGSIIEKKKNLVNKSYQCLPQFPQSNDSMGSTIYKEVIDNNEINKNSIAWDLKSIVKQNIGKYRELREKQKLKSAQVERSRTTLGTKNKNRTRSEPIAKNKHLYLKPLKKGWKRELVFRTNCTKPGQQADVYYFHPNGKKLRSCREIAENLTRGLTVEYFTFRKEPLGCGEPLEVIRNARSHIKSLLQSETI